MFAGYRIERVLDRGGMGVVYKAVDPDLDREVALKIIAPEHTQDETAVARFKAECRLAASLEHPNIVPIHRGGEFEGILYLAMRFVPGTNLRAVIDRGPMDLRRVGQHRHAGRGRARRRAREGARAPRRQARQHPHLGHRGQAARLPHGLRADQAAGLRRGEALTREGGWVGTPDYVAPEQIQGHKVDRRADVYSLGCVLFEMLTGHVAYEKDSDMAKLWAHVTDPPPLPRTIRPELIASFDDIVARATAKEPGHRYATAGALAEVTRDALAAQQAASRRSAAAAASALPRRPTTTSSHARGVDRRPRASHAPPPPPTPPPPPRGRSRGCRRRRRPPVRPRAPAPLPRPRAAHAARRRASRRPRGDAARPPTGGCAAAPSRWPGCSCCCSASSSPSSCSAARTPTTKPKVVGEPHRRQARRRPDEPRRGQRQRGHAPGRAPAVGRADERPAAQRRAARAAHPRGREGHLPDGVGRREAQRPPVDRHARGRAVLRRAGPGDDDERRHDPRQEPARVQPLSRHGATSPTSGR